MKCDDGCLNCKHYTLAGDYVRCEWFECRISKIFPRWVDDFRLGKIRFCNCGFFERKPK